MSWNKNTINRSTVDGTISVLKNLGTPYKVTILGRVMGLGLNDDIFQEDIKGMLHRESKHYEIRKLKYKDVIILEKMVRSGDCDADDYIVSYEFKINNVPKNWKIEETNE